MMENGFLISYTCVQTFHDLTCMYETVRHMRDFHRGETVVFIFITLSKL